MQKNWSEVWRNLNQKCLDKRKQHLKTNRKLVPMSEEGKKNESMNDHQNTNTEDQMKGQIKTNIINEQCECM